MVLYGNGVSYHFRFTDEVALFTRHGNTVAYFAIAPDVMHTYRIELLEDETYRFLIDGTVVESRIQPGPFPNSASQIVWGGEFDPPGHTDQWDYVRYGTIPEPATGLLLLAGAGAIIARRKRRSAQS